MMLWQLSTLNLDGLCLGLDHFFPQARARMKNKLSLKSKPFPMGCGNHRTTRWHQGVSRVEIQQQSSSPDGTDVSAAFAQDPGMNTVYISLPYVWAWS